MKGKAPLAFLMIFCAIGMGFCAHAASGSLAEEEKIAPEDKPKYKKAVAGLKEDVQVLATVLQDTENSRRMEEDRADKLEEALKGQDAEIRRLKEEAKRAHDGLARIEKERQDAIARLEIERKEKEAKQAQNAEAVLQKLKEELDKEKKGREKEREELEKELKDKKGNLERLESLRKDAELQRKERGAYIDTLERKIASYAESRAAGESDEELKRGIEKLKKDLLSGRASLKKVMDEKRKVEKARAKIEKDEKHTREKIRGHEADFESKIAYSQREVKRFKEIQDEIERVLPERTALGEALKRIEEEERKIQEHVNALGARPQPKEGEAGDKQDTDKLAKAQGWGRRIGTRANSAREKNREAEERYEILKAELASLSVGEGQAQGQIENIKDEIEKLKKKLAGLEESKKANEAKRKELASAAFLAKVGLKKTQDELRLKEEDMEIEELIFAGHKPKQKTLGIENKALKEELKKTLAKTREMEQKSKRIKELENALAKQESLYHSLEAANSQLAKDAKSAAKSKTEAERRKRLTEAEIEELERETKKDRIDMHYNLAVVYDKNGMYGDAECEYLKCLEIDPEDAEAHYNLAILYDDKLHKETKAIIHYERYLVLKPKDESGVQVKQWMFKAELEKRIGAEVR